MRMVHVDEQAFARVSGHRDGDIQFKKLISGTAGAPDNFEFALVRQRGRYETPRHRHNYEQFRFVLEGEYAYAGRRRMRTGTIGYFPEGTPYGPQKIDDCTVLAVQFGGPSGQGVLDYESLRRGHGELAELGRFEKGAFVRHDAKSLPSGVKRKQDGYEAIWEHVTGRKLTYAKARYVEPVICDPAHVPWEATATPGVAVRRCGSFAAGASISFWRLEPEAALAVSGAGAQLVYVLEGQGSVGATAWRAGSALAVEPGEAATLTATGPSHILQLGLPHVPAEAAQRAAA